MIISSYYESEACVTDAMLYSDVLCYKAVFLVCAAS